MNTSRPLKETDLWIGLEKHIDKSFEDQTLLDLVFFYLSQDRPLIIRNDENL